MIDHLTSRISHADGVDLDLLKSMFVDIDVRTRASISEVHSSWLFQGIGVVRSVTHGGTFKVLRDRNHIKVGSVANGVFLCLQLKGAVNLAQAERDCILQQGDFGLLDSRHEYEIDIHEGSESVWLKIPPERFDTRRVNPLNVVARRKGNRDGIERITSEFLRAFVSQIAGLQQQRHPLLASVLMDLVSGVCEEDTGPARGVNQSLSRFRTWRRACAYIENHVAEEGLNPRQIASAIGVSTRYLSELFAENGNSPMQWIIMRRLELCRKALEATNWTPGVVTDIVFRYGFTNVSSFNRAFKKRYGAPPRRFMLN